MYFVYFLESQQWLRTINCPNPAIYNPADLNRQGENQDEGVATNPEDER